MFIRVSMRVIIIMTARVIVPPWLPLHNTAAWLVLKAKVMRRFQRILSILIVTIKPSQAAQKASEPGRRFRGEVEHYGGQELPAEPAKKIQQLGEG